MKKQKIQAAIIATWRYNMKKQKIQAAITAARSGLFVELQPGVYIQGADELRESDKSRLWIQSDVWLTTDDGYATPIDSVEDIIAEVGALA